MNSKLIGGLCALIAVASQLPAVAQNPIGTPVVPSDFDYKYQPKDPDLGRVDPPIYYSLPDLAYPDRTLPAAFKFPIMYDLGTDDSITSDAVITDTVFIPNLPPIPNGITLDDIPRIRAEYTRKVEEWGETGSRMSGFKSFNHQNRHRQPRVNSTAKRWNSCS
ncbi:MAG: hypothetical protein RSE13_13190 [Planktothrix sp. GU0601_MAG3]|nr:MAG: hypothetical protein RSE13_13190 [Planktothrix sp. GU0601_MAG3]